MRGREQSLDILRGISIIIFFMSTIALLEQWHIWKSQESLAECTQRFREREYNGYHSFA